jgi:hypothetical protein
MVGEAMTIRLYKNHIEKAGELLVRAKECEVKASGYLYEAIVAITQAINELESAEFERKG